ncbi:MAG: HAD-IB family hydrolase [Peptostreptococcaceae bacterium]
MKKIAAFFDIDGTLYRDSLMIDHLKKLVKYDVVDKKEWYSDVRETYIHWDKRIGNYDVYLDNVCELYIKSLVGLDKNCINFSCDQVIKLKSERVYKYTRSKIKWHLENNHIVIFISGSPTFLVERMANKYLATDFAGTNYIFENGFFNGDVIPMWDSNSKNIAIDKFVDKYDIDLANSYAYGDTNGDINMLRRVGNPIAINPTNELLKNIKNDNNIKDKTKVIIERKDVIYTLDSSTKIIDV